MNLKDVLTKTIEFFREKKLDSPRLDAELLIAHALKLNRIDLYLKYEQPLSEIEIQNCRDVVKRRSLGEPVAYITEEKGFFGHNFFIQNGVLIPRPETETLIELVLEFFKDRKTESLNFLDLGGGSGCIGLTLAKEFLNSQVTIVEFSKKPLDCILKNRDLLGLTDRVQIIDSTAEVFLNAMNSTFDGIFSNPPYIDEADPLVEPSVRKFEPHEALFAENQGLKLIYDWSKLSAPKLKLPGLMIFEIGHQQGDAVKKHFDALQKFSSTNIIKDLSGLDRFIKAVR